MESCSREGHERERGLKREDAQEREKWRKLLWGAASHYPCISGGNGSKTIVVVVIVCCF